jgi:hypothetical protein
MPPVAEIARQAHAEGALLDLDKHNWPWSMMLVPIAGVDLFELANNSVWRTEFGFRQSTTPWAQYMDVETNERGMTEWGWLNFGFQNYYALLNCGFRLQPTAGTASGVHPVPLGFSRVYVHLPDGFRGKDWLAGLRNGASFVTTGPMLLATVDGQPPGHVFQQSQTMDRAYRLRGESLSDGPLERMEVIVNGQLHQRVEADNQKTAAGAYRTEFEIAVPIAETSWIAVRSIQRKDMTRVRFAHTAPWHVEVAEQPIRPREQEIDFLVRRVRDELQRNAEILPEPALDEFREALRIYEEIARRARKKEK